MDFDYRFFDSRPTITQKAMRKALYRGKSFRDGFWIPAGVMKAWRFALIRFKSIGWKKIDNDLRYVVTRNCRPCAFGFEFPGRSFSCDFAHVCPWCWVRTKTAPIVWAVRSVKKAERRPWWYVTTSELIPVSEEGYRQAHERFADFRLCIQTREPKGTASIWSVVPADEGRMLATYRSLFFIPERDDFRSELEQALGAFPGTRIKQYREDRGVHAAIRMTKYPFALLRRPSPPVVEILNLRPDRIRAVVYSGLLAPKYRRARKRPVVDV